ncbi:hypothetical protein ACFP81_04650 [Deinococcus lacus]|uniref:Uncharacterized protein n=1 Tax=Deinococcus lacus TaxID=392561 RepID=A0ABW1YD36_9DEIO
MRLLPQSAAVGRSSGAADFPKRCAWGLPCPEACPVVVEGLRRKAVQKQALWP